MITAAKRAKVLRAFVADGGGLTSMPRAGHKRQIVLEHVVTAFEPGWRYSEAEVNAVLRAFHSDVAALRRYLVDAELMDRRGGIYWRTGGWVETVSCDR